VDVRVLKISAALPRARRLYWKEQQAKARTSSPGTDPLGAGRRSTAADAWFYRILA
jgi:hypothetical protein